MNLGNHHVLDSLESSSANQLLRSNLINRYTLKRRALPLLLMLQHLKARDIEVPLFLRIYSLEIRDIEVKVEEFLAIADSVATSL